jgi:pilus assembly protein CpaC
LANIPLLGYLFRSRSENRSKSELIVMVTPEFVDPMNPDDPRLKTQQVTPTLKPLMLPSGVPNSKTPLKPMPPAPSKREEIFQVEKPPTR